VLWTLILALLQAAQTPATPAASGGPLGVRGDRFQIIVPQGWKTLRDGSSVLLEHSSGASLLIQRTERNGSLADLARRQAERIMMPLGFARLGEPRQFKDTHDEWIQYEIFGNRLDERHRLLYRLLRRDTGFFESVYEAPEDRFDLLLTEAQGIAASVQAIIEAPPRPRRPSR
jgi:hypothetical protein